MELLTGINKYVSQNTITEEDIINLGLDLSEALEYCEKLNIIHRDIKPENIFISKFGEYKLGDFGIARKLENTSSIMSKKGTYIYMPPEVYKGEEYDKTVDIYSLGLVMYKLGNENRTPFLPKAPNPITYRDKEKALMMRMQGEKIPKPDNMSEELYKIIEKMIAYNPEDRYQNAKELKEDLEKLKEKNAKKYTGTVNIFTHKSTKKIEPLEPKEENKQEIIETREENIEPIVNVEESEIVENIEAEQAIADEQVVKEKIPEEMKTEKEEFVQTKVQEPVKNSKKKKIIIAVIALLLIIACIVGAILLSKNKNTETSNTIVMPNLINLTREEADKELEGKEIEIVYQDTYQEGAEKGKIVYQSIAADMEIEKGTKVVVFINNLEKDQVEKVIMPRVIDMNIGEATNQLLQLGLQVERIDEINETIAKDIVFEQDIPENTEIEQGSKVVLKVSLGAKEQSNQSITGNISNSNWSSWMENLPSGINNSNSSIQTKTQYSYRTKETTTSTSTSMNGWTQNGVVSTTYSDWSEEKINEPSYAYPKESDTLRVLRYERTIAVWYHWSADTNGDGVVDNVSGSIDKASDTVKELAQKHYYNNKQVGEYPQMTKCPICGTMFWYEEDVVKQGGYVYQTRTLLNVYEYYRWSDWSAYSDTPATANATTEVQTRTLYRYKAK